MKKERIRHNRELVGHHKRIVTRAGLSDPPCFLRGLKKSLVAVRKRFVVNERRTGDEDKLRKVS